jgi:hypothetical protein
VNGAAVWGAIAANLTLTASIGVYVIKLAFQSGERSRQIEVNTEAIRIINDRGSPGVRDRFNAIDEQLKIIQQRLEDMQQQLNQVLRKA